MEPMRRQLGRKGERGGGRSVDGRDEKTDDDDRIDEPQPEVDPSERKKGSVEGSAVGGESVLVQRGLKAESATLKGDGTRRKGEQRLTPDGHRVGYCHRLTE